MAPTVISLPPLELNRQVDQLHMQIDGFLQLDFPVGTSDVPLLLQELENMVTEEQLWVRRVGTCKLTIKLLHDGCTVSDSLTGYRMSDVVIGLEIWHRLGLSLKPCTASGDNVHSLAFSIQHPDLSSALIAPHSSLTAGLASTHLTIETRTPPRGRKRKSCVPRSADTMRSLWLNDELLHAQQRQDDVMKAILQPNDQLLRSITAGLGSDLCRTGTHSDGRILTSMTGNHGVEVEAVSGLSPEDYFPETPKTAFSEDILAAALEAVMIGKGPRLKGWRWTSDRNWTGLTKIAPAVFHMPFLQDVAQKAKFVPTIATCLVKMMHAESPGLRQLISSFESLRPPSESTVSGQSNRTDKVLKGIEGSIWRTLVANTAVPRVKSSAAASAATHKAPESGGESLLCISDQGLDEWEVRQASLADGANLQHVTCHEFASIRTLSSQTKDSSATLPVQSGLQGIQSSLDSKASSADEGSILLWDESPSMASDGSPGENWKTSARQSTSTLAFHTEEIDVGHTLRWEA